MGRFLGQGATLGALLLIGLCIGCAHAPRSAATDSSRTVYLRGIETEWSARLDRLGDAELLDAGSSMRHALVAGDETFFVATSGFQVGSTFALDMIVVNHRDQEVTMRTEDVHLIDATGRWLAPTRMAPRAASRGLQGKHFASVSPSTLFQDFGGEELGGDTTMSQLQGAMDGRAKGSPSSSARQRRFPRLSSNSQIATASALATEVVSSVRVAPGEGRAFWAYFEDDAPRFPLTAWITLETGEQLRYEFTR
jgi:hypothetical protein